MVKCFFSILSHIVPWAISWLASFILSATVSLVIFVMSGPDFVCFSSALTDCRVSMALSMATRWIVLIAPTMSLHVESFTSAK